MWALVRLYLVTLDEVARVAHELGPVQPIKVVAYLHVLQFLKHFVQRPKVIILIDICRQLTCCVEKLFQISGLALTNGKFDGAE